MFLKFLIKQIIVKNMDINIPSFVTVDKTKKSGTYVRYPEREELNSEINEALIVEYYNR